MVMTEEQKERARKNLERAMEIQRRRKLEQAEAEAAERGAKRLKPSPAPSPAATANKTGSGAGGKGEGAGEEGDDVELEDFEVGASEWVSKKEAKEKYCLPEGTLAVCKFEERPNPHNKGWKPMKLYSRKEVRMYSRKRFGGLDGLIEERRKRQEKKYQKDLEQTKDLLR